MKASQQAYCIMLCTALAVIFFGSDTGWAFHSGGVGECDGCHSIHNSREGMATVTNALPTGTSNVSLLKGSDAGSTCLNCHQQSGDAGPTTYHVSTPQSEIPPGIPPKQLSPGGDFGWLKKTYSWVPSFGSPMEYSYGDSHGHNIIAMDYGYVQDSYRVTAPGGSYPASSLTCTSCHDPHGKYRRNSDGSITSTGLPIKDSGSYVDSPDPDGQTSVGAYRMLGGIGYSPKSLGNAFAFSASPPVVLSPTIYNKSETTGPTRIAYGQGMSEWCRNCHSSIHTSSPFEHKASSSDGKLEGSIISYYNQYVKTGDLTGTEMTAYSSLVPFEIGTTNYPTLRNIITTTPTKGPSTADGSPAVMCLTCHRAHAGGWDQMTRWNNRSTYIVYNGFYSQAGSAYQPYGQGRSELEALKAYYDTPASTFSPLQTTLCSKCHATVPN